MSPTEFSNYIKQRAMQQQLHHSHGHSNGYLGPIGTSSPSRSISPNPMGMNGTSGVQDPYFFPSNGMTNGGGMYSTQFNGPPRNMFDSPHFAQHPSDTLYPGGGGGGGSTSGGGGGKYSPYLEPHFYGGMNGGNMTGNNTGIVGQISNGPGNTGSSSSNGLSIGQSNNSANGNNSQTPVSSPGSSNQDNSKLLDGLNSFYSNPGPYQHLLVAN